MAIEMAAEFWQMKELQEHTGLLQAEVTTSRKFEAWKEGQKTRRENKKAVEDFEDTMESVRQMGLAGAQTLLLMLEEWEEMHMSV